jgi:hypothetical protein
MKRISIVGALIGVALAVTMTASAATPVPFPSPTVRQVFVAAQTVTTDGAMSSWFTPGSSVVFRAYAVDPKTHKVVDPKLVKYFYVSIPGQPNVKLTYGATAPGASTGLPWSGTWSVPSSFAGQVNFKILIQVKGSNGKQLKGQFQQMPSATAALTISPTAPTIYTPGASQGDAGVGTAALNASLYVDTVNGSGPVGIAKRPVGCSLTNVYKRGEQVVVRVWGADDAGNVLSNDNVNTAHFSVAGVPDTTLNYGAHGTLYFWANAFVIPATYPLGTTTIHVVFNLLNGKTASYDYTINVIPT